ncbi:hypothetical protein QQ73_09735, partial [Candidatus Endoriftia persephone str. Guaymas]|nr:hypothetical protein [Candidatus Endoriftia persephone str. Guaymas]
RGRAKVGEEKSARERSKQHKRRLWLKDLLFQETRRNLLGSTALMALAAPGALAVLAAKVVAPLKLGQLSARLRERYETPV